mgnify:CR=1 FL=1
MARKTTRVFNTTQEDIDKINPNNLELMEEYLDYYSADHAEKSVKVIRSNLNIFFVWVLHNLNNKDFSEIKKRDLLKYQNYLSKNGLSPARVRGLRSAISSMSNFIEDILADDEERFENFRNNVNKIKAPKLVQVREKTVLTDEQVEAYLDSLVSRKKYSHACALALAWASGRRKSELLRFKVSFFDDKYLQYGCLYESPKKIKTKGSGKLGKPLTVYVLKPKFKKYLDLWLEERRRLGIPDTIDDLFVDETGVPFGEARLQSYADTFSREMNVDFYFHCLRHNFTTELLRQGIPAEVIKELVGWESVEMVSTYDDRSASESFGMYFGEDGIKKVEAKSLTDL